MHAARPVGLVVRDVTRPRLAPDLDDDAVLRPYELDEDEWLSVALLAEEGVVGVGEALGRVERDRTHVLLVRGVL